MTDGFFKRWLEGMRNLSPRKQLEANLAFSWGNLIGFFGGTVSMLIYVIFAKQWQYWWTVLILALAFCVTIVDLIAKHQQMKAMDEMDEQLKNISEARL